MKGLDASQASSDVTKAMVANARLAKMTEVAGGGVGVGLAVVSISMDGPGLGWDSSAKDAWTNGEAL